MSIILVPSQDLLSSILTCKMGGMPKFNLRNCVNNQCCQFLKKFYEVDFGNGKNITIKGQKSFILYKHIPTLHLSCRLKTLAAFDVAFLSTTEILYSLLRATTTAATRNDSDSHLRRLRQNYGRIKRRALSSWTTWKRPPLV